MANACIDLAEAGASKIEFNHLSWNANNESIAFTASIKYHSLNVGSSVNQRFKPPSSSLLFWIKILFIAYAFTIGENSFTSKAKACEGNPVWVAIESPEFRPGISRSKLLSLIQQCAGYNPDEKFWSEEKLTVCPQSFIDGGSTIFEFEFRDNHLVWYKTHAKQGKC